MSGEIFDVLARLGAAAGAAVSVKLMDDFLDQDLDREFGQASLSARLGRGVLAYALASLAMAALLNWRWATTLFLGAYALGMADEPGRRQPSGLTGWQEGALAMVGAALATGWQEAVSSLAAVAFAQAVDDVLDGRAGYRRPRGLARVWGTGESVLLGALAAAVGLYLDPVKAVIVATIGGAISLLSLPGDLT